MKKATCPTEQSRPNTHPDGIKKHCVTSRFSSSIFRQLHHKEMFEQAEALNALRRLYDAAANDTGQSVVIGNFLLGLYNGKAYPFNLTKLRRLDTSLHNDCLAALQLDHQPLLDVHEYFENGTQLINQLCKQAQKRD